MTTPPTPATPAPDNDADALARLAEDVERQFNARGLTLTDDEHAAAFQLTIEWCAKAVEGSQATGLLNVDPKELAELLAVIRGMKAAPRLI